MLSQPRKGRGSFCFQAKANPVSGGFSSREAPRDGSGYVTNSALRARPVNQFGLTRSDSGHSSEQLNSVDILGRFTENFVNSKTESQCRAFMEHLVPIP
jgi:hypothetical protein